MTRGQRLAALTGTGFFVLAIGGRLAYPDDPGFPGDPAAIAAFYSGESSGILAGNVLYLIGIVFLLWFAGALRSALRRAEGGDGQLAATAFGGAVAGASLMLAGGAADAAAALRVEDEGAIAEPVATVLWDVNSVMFGLAAPTAFAVLVLATSVIGLRTRALPLWHGVAGVPLGVALAIPPISYIAILVFLFWVLATSLLLAVREVPQHAADGRPGTTVGSPVTA